MSLNKGEDSLLQAPKTKSQCLLITPQAAVEAGSFIKAMTVALRGARVLGDFVCTLIRMGTTQGKYH